MPAHRSRNNRAHEVDRTLRVSELIHRELSVLLLRESDDPRLKMVAITGVTISRDLKQATVYVSSAQSSSVSAAGIESACNEISKHLRGLLGRNLQLRNTPALRFQYDHSIRRGMELSNLIDSLNRR